MIWYRFHIEEEKEEEVFFSPVPGSTRQSGLAWGA
jgi:hypothetical protein